MEYTLLFFTISAMLISVSASWNLSGQNVTVLTGDEANLRCEITMPTNSTEEATHLWRADELLFFDEKRGQATDSMTVAFNDAEMSLTIAGVTLDDEKPYQCSLLSITPPQHATVWLTVNQYPQEFYVTNFDESPTSGSAETVAKCITKGSKPAPTMWFTDEFDDEVDVSEDMEITVHDNGLVDASLALKTVFYERDHGMTYKCNVRRADGSEVSEATAPVNVLYESSANLVNVNEDEHRVLQEGEEFEATCIGIGNPTPEIEWTFTPDDDTNVTMAGQTLPANFLVSANGRMIFAEAVIVSGEASTNNGTFVCKASNGIGSPVLLSFRLGVHAAPVTTVPTTPEATPIMEPHSAGSNAAVIGGVVAVAAFVLIVAVILIVRYFMSHKGTYHTHEMKSRELEEDRIGEEQPMVDDDLEDELGNKKRTEYFM